MNHSVLIIGKKSFIGYNLNKYLKNFFKVDILSFEDLYKNKLNIYKYSHIINTSIHKNYIKKNYNRKFDLDRMIIDKFYNSNFKFIFMNTRKIYKPKINISEKSRIKPIDQYAKNKIKKEKYLKKKLKKNLLSLRISNVLGKRPLRNRRVAHDLFLDNFIKFKKKNKKIKVKNEFKDFISINHLCLVIKKLIKNDIYGVFNVSMSKKIYVSEITRWLSKTFYKKITFIKSSEDSFTLSNKKLVDKIDINISKIQLKNFCENLNI